MTDSPAPREALPPKHDRPTLEAIRAWWRKFDMSFVSPPTKADWDALDAAIRADERALIARRALPVRQEPTEAMDWNLAKAAGCVFYELPDTLDYSTLDPLIAPICRAINESGWVATGESCQGHPDESGFSPWCNNVMPYLRLTVCANDAGGMLALLMLATLPTAAIGEGRAHPLTLRLTEDGRGGPDWRQFYVYVLGATTYDRNEGLAALARFAHSLPRAALAVPPTDGSDHA